MVRLGRLRWFGHVERKQEDYWVFACRNLVVEGNRGRGRGKKSWMECVKDVMRRINLPKEKAQDRASWKSGIRGNRLTRACLKKRRKTMMMMMMMMSLAIPPFSLSTSKIHYLMVR